MALSPKMKFNFTKIILFLGTNVLQNNVPSELPGPKSHKTNLLLKEVFIRGKKMSPLLQMVKLSQVLLLVFQMTPSLAFSQMTKQTLNF